MTITKTGFDQVSDDANTAKQREQQSAQIKKLVQSHVPCM